MKVSTWFWIGGGAALAYWLLTRPKTAAKSGTISAQDLPRVPEDGAIAGVGQLMVRGYAGPIREGAPIKVYPDPTVIPEQLLAHGPGMAPRPELLEYLNKPTAWGVPTYKYIDPAVLRQILPEPGRQPTLETAPSERQDRPPAPAYYPAQPPRAAVTERVPQPAYVPTAAPPPSGVIRVEPEPAPQTQYMREPKPVEVEKKSEFPLWLIPVALLVLGQS